MGGRNRLALAALLCLIPALAGGQALPGGAGGGSSSGGAPTNAQYWVAAPNGSLSAEVDLSALGTGLVLNTAGTPTAYAGTSCTNQFPRSLNASGSATCASVANADLTNSSITIDGSAIALGASGSSAPPFSAVTSATNTVATMSCGTGCRVEPTANGTVHANELANRKVSGYSGPAGILITTSSTPASNVVPKLGSDGNLTSSLLQDDGTTVSVNGTGVGQFALRDLGSTYGTFLAPNAFSTARTYHLPNATGTIALMNSTAVPANGQLLLGHATNGNFSLTALGVSGGLTIATSAGGLNIQQSIPRMCDIVIGSEDGSALTTANLAPQRWFCTVVATGTIVEIRLDSDAGNPRVMVQKRTPGPSATSTNLLANGLTVASSAVVCARPATGVGVDMRTNCGNTLSVTSVSPGDSLGFGQAMTAASGVEKMVRGTVYYTVP